VQEQKLYLLVVFMKVEI